MDERLEIVRRLIGSIRVLRFSMNDSVNEFPGGAVVTRSPLTATTQVQLQATCGMSFTLYRLNFFELQTCLQHDFKV